MSHYKITRSAFEPVDFSKLRKKLAGEEEVKERWVKQSKLEEAMRRIDLEIDMVFTGESSLSSRTPYDRPPVLHALKRLKERGTITNIENFLELSEQDFGIKVKKQFINILKGCWEEKKDAKADV